MRMEVDMLQEVQETMLPPSLLTRSFIVLVVAV